MHTRCIAYLALDTGARTNQYIQNLSSPAIRPTTRGGAPSIDTAGVAAHDSSRTRDAQQDPETLQHSPVRSPPAEHRRKSLHRWFLAVRKKPFEQPAGDSYPRLFCYVLLCASVWVQC